MASQDVECQMINDNELQIFMSVNLQSREWLQNETISNLFFCFNAIGKEKMSIVFRNQI